MILLLTASGRAEECARAVQVATGHPVHCAKSLQDGLGLLRANQYLAVVLDQCVLDADPDQAELLIQHFGTATPVYVNGAIAGVERIVRDLRAALARRQVEMANARNCAEASLCSELRESLTALLLNCDLALEIPNLDPKARSKIELIHQMGRHLADRLEVNEPTSARA